MDTLEPRRKRGGRARERQATRQRRREDFAVLRSDVPSVDLSGVKSSELTKRALVVLNDLRWYLLHKPKIWQVAAVVFGVLFLMFAGTHLLGGRTFPNVWSLDANIGGMNEDEALTVLNNAWASERIALVVEGETVLSASPADIGLLLDPRATFEQARSVGLSGIPLGYNITPVVTVDYVTAQNYFLNLTNQVEIAPSNAGYTWQGAELVGVAGSTGRALDVTLTLQNLQQDPAGVVERRRFDLQMAVLPPDTTDPSPFLETARSFASRNVVIHGYDPFRDESVDWTTTPEEQARWLEATGAGLVVREDVFTRFIDSLNNTLNPAGSTDVRYIEVNEARDLVSSAINGGASDVTLRIRYQRATYEVVGGDTGYGIGRRTGIPYNLIAEQNSGRDMNQLFRGDTIYLPSRDVTLPIMPVANKRIIVNLETQSLIAYENGVPVFNWLISSGMDTAPTYPGVFQIQSHNDVALGSSYTLCSSDLSCGQWEMYWFMGIYEVVPGLMNGFHGGVLLPNGAYLGGGNVGAKYTFGCIMSQNENAEELYDWAQDGTVVEIISQDFPPQSDLARQWLAATQ
ncbi:MAG: L,D-transpeptidase family protein [Anaerolineae bacterium]